VEQGSHSQLIARPEGAYSTLVGLQMRALEKHAGDGQQAAGAEEEAEEPLVAPKQGLVGTSYCLQPACVHSPLLSSCSLVVTKTTGKACEHGKDRTVRKHGPELQSARKSRKPPAKCVSMLLVPSTFPERTWYKAAKSPPLLNCRRNTSYLGGLAFSFSNKKKTNSPNCHTMSRASVLPTMSLGMLQEQTPAVQSFRLAKGNSASFKLSRTASKLSRAASSEMHGEGDGQGGGKGRWWPPRLAMLSRKDPEEKPKEEKAKVSVF